MGKVCACLLSHYSRVQLCTTLWTVACQAPLSLRFSTQEYEVEMPSSRGLSLLRIKPGSPALQVVSLLTESLGKPQWEKYLDKNTKFLTEKSKI